MNWVMLTLVILVTGFAAGFFVKHYHPKIGWAILVVMLAAALCIGVGTAVCWDAPSYEDLEPDYALLLGCALDRGQATPELVQRCKAALDWLEANPEGLMVVSGGDPSGWGVTEAAVMAAWLRNHGADAAQIVLEDQASDTRENLLFSKTLMQDMERETDTVLIITSEYHQTRAKFLAEQGGQQVIGISSRTPLVTRVQGTVREVYAFIKAIFETL